MGFKKKQHVISHFIFFKIVKLQLNVYAENRLEKISSLTSTSVRPIYDLEINRVTLQKKLKKERRPNIIKINVYLISSRNFLPCLKIKINRTKFFMLKFFI